MSSISSVGGSAASQFAQKATATQQAKPAADPDRDGDNDAGVSKTQEAREQRASASVKTPSGGIDMQG